MFQSAINALKFRPAAWRGMPLILVMITTSALTACSGKKEAARIKPPAPVTVAVAQQKSVPVQLRAIGNVEAYNTVSIKAQINGEIARVHFTEGQDVRKGDLLFTIDQRPFIAALKQAEAALAKDLAQAKYAREQARRYGALLKDGIVTQDQCDQLNANADAYDAAIASDRAVVDNARVQMGYCSIRSPIDGRTGNMAVKVGNLVKANDVPVLVTINQLTPILVTFVVPEKNLAEIKKHLAVGPLKVEAAIPNDHNGKESGTISFLDNAVDATTGTIKLKGVFANGKRTLWPGQFVDVILTLSIRPNAVVVPTQAVQTGQNGEFIFVVKPDQTVESRQVTTGAALNGESVIESGIRAGETVVTDGQLMLLPGTRVALKPGDGGTARVSSAAAVPKPDQKQ